MMNLHHFFLPHQKNNHRPYLLRYQSLAVLTAAVLIVQTFINFYYFSTPRVLGFATSISSGEIISLTNSQRQQNGAGQVSESSLLNQAAQLKAQDMFNSNYWAHTNPYDPAKDPWYWFEQVGYDYYMAGENLAMNFDTSAGVINGWMNSPSHRDNLLNGNYTEIGVAVVNGVLLGEETTLVVQLFGRPLGAPVVIANNPPTIPAPTTAPQPTLTPVPAQPTVTPTLAPTPTPTPEPQTITAVVRDPEDNTPIQTNATLFGGEQRWRTVGANLANPFSMNPGRLVMLGTLVFLTTIFMIDSLIIVHKQHFHVPRSHGFIHAGLMIILAIALVYNSVGTVL
jgi:uncharacterized protein YkwD